jgi:hypothetical protein
MPTIPPCLLYSLAVRRVHFHIPALHANCYIEPFSFNHACLEIPVRSGLSDHRAAIIYHLASMGYYMYPWSEEVDKYTGGDFLRATIHTSLGEQVIHVAIRDEPILGICTPITHIYRIPAVVAEPAFIWNSMYFEGSNPFGSIFADSGESTV